MTVGALTHGLITHTISTTTAANDAIEGQRLGLTDRQVRDDKKDGLSGQRQQEKNGHQLTYVKKDEH